jgi:hypothetical protein
MWDRDVALMKLNTSFRIPKVIIGLPEVFMYKFMHIFILAFLKLCQALT